jgi:hypothetical protein
MPPRGPHALGQNSAGPAPAHMIPNPAAAAIATKQIVAIPKARHFE